MKIQLVDVLSRAPVKNSNKVILNLSLHTWEIPSNPILRNKTGILISGKKYRNLGNKAIMGETESELRNGETVFDRIQINEVTSKFIHGYIAMLVVPSKPTNYGTSIQDQERTDSYIDFELIKPLMIEKVVVKSKKKKNQKMNDS